MLTKLDIAAIRSADDLCVHLSSDRTIVRLIKRKRVSEKDPFAQDVEHILPAAVQLYGYRGHAESPTAPDALRANGYITTSRRLPLAFSRRYGPATN